MNKAGTFSKTGIGSPHPELLLSRHGCCAKGLKGCPLPVVQNRRKRWGQNHNVPVKRAAIKVARTLTKQVWISSGILMTCPTCWCGFKVCITFAYARIYSPVKGVLCETVAGSQMRSCMQKECVMRVDVLFPKKYDLYYFSQCIFALTMEIKRTTRLYEIRFESYFVVSLEICRSMQVTLYEKLKIANSTRILTELNKVIIIQRSTFDNSFIKSTN